MPNKNDVIKTAVLKFLYSIHEEDPRWVTDEEIIQGLEYIPKNKVIAAIEFLTDEGYLKHRQVAMGAANRYRISSKGVQQISPSVFGPEPVSSINISSKGGIFVFGDNLGTIKQETVSSVKELSELIKEIKKLDLSDNKKRNLIGDAETIKAQMTKPTPDKTIIQKAFDSLQNLSGVIELAGLLKNIAELLAPYIKL